MQYNYNCVKCAYFGLIENYTTTFRTEQAKID